MTPRLCAAISRSAVDFWLNRYIAMVMVWRPVQPLAVLQPGTAAIVLSRTAWARRSAVLLPAALLNTTPVFGVYGAASAVGTRYMLISAAPQIAVTSVANNRFIAPSSFHFSPGMPPHPNPRVVDDRPAMEAGASSVCWLLRSRREATAAKPAIRWVDRRHDFGISTPTHNNFADGRRTGSAQSAGPSWRSRAWKCCSPWPREPLEASSARRQVVIGIVTCTGRITGARSTAPGSRSRTWPGWRHT